MLSESILYNNRIWAIMLLLIVTVMFCGFNSTAIRAERLDSNSGDNPAVSVSPVTSNNQSSLPEPAQTFLVESGFYHHPADIFSFDLPSGWQLVSQTDSMAVFTQGQAELGALFTYTGQNPEPKLLSDFCDTFVAGFLNFADDYTIERPELQPDQSIRLTIRYHSANEGEGQVNFLFEQHETVMFVLYLRTPTSGLDEATWARVMESHTVK